MSADRVAAITSLLVETSQAHGRFEETELKGVYDRDWSRWYAGYAVKHDIGALIGHEITADALATYLARTNVELEQTNPKPTESWAAWTARRIAAEL